MAVNVARHSYHVPVSRQMIWAETTQSVTYPRACEDRKLFKLILSSKGLEELYSICLSFQLPARAFLQGNTLVVFEDAERSAAYSHSHRNIRLVIHNSPLTPEIPLLHVTPDRVTNDFQCIELHYNGHKAGQRSIIWCVPQVSLPPS